MKRKRKTSKQYIVFALGFLGILMCVLIIGKYLSRARAKEIMADAFNGEEYLSNVYLTSSKNGEITFLYKNAEYTFEGELEQEYVGIADLEFADGKIQKVYTKATLKDGVLCSYENDWICFDDGVKRVREVELPIYQKLGEQVSQISMDELVLGGSKVKYCLAENVVCGLIVEEKPITNSIRVLIKNGDFVAFPKIWIKSEGQIYEMTSEGTFTSQNELLYYSLDGINFCEEGYEGTFHIVMDGNEFVLINELPVEDYVRYVLPSEMPISFSYEALKAQAVCARTFAYQQMKNQTYAKYGANLDDSTAFQVYHNAGCYDITNQAVWDTSGMVLKQNDELITCYYFSTCSNMTETPKVWTGEETGYLSSVESKDETSPFYSWSAQLDTSQVLDASLGALKKIEIQSVGESGYVLKLSLTYENGSKLIENENEIRQELGKYLSNVTLSDGKIRNDLSMIPSACFTIIETGDGYIKISGGGFGHGVGMSQYGAKELAEEGKNFEEILKYYYSNVELSAIE